jgi:hypothetical protein
MNIKQDTNKIYLKKLAVGVLLGAIGGFSYYHFIGCNSGSCAIQSNLYLVSGKNSL